MSGFAFNKLFRLRKRNDSKAQHQQLSKAATAIVKQIWYNTPIGLIERIKVLVCDFCESNCEISTNSTVEKRTRQGVLRHGQQKKEKST